MLLRAKMPDPLHRTGACLSRGRAFLMALFQPAEGESRAPLRKAGGFFRARHAGFLCGSAGCEAPGRSWCGIISRAQMVDLFLNVGPHALQLLEGVRAPGQWNAIG